MRVSRYKYMVHRCVGHWNAIDGFPITACSVNSSFFIYHGRIHCLASWAEARLTTNSINVTDGAFSL
jgi:hypothetical protein